MQAIAAGAYAVLGLAFLALLTRTLYVQPLFPLLTGDPVWASTWLLTTVADYYVSTLCFCGVVMHTEPSRIRGLLWCTAFCLLGSPWCCLWVVLRLCKHGTLELIDKENADYTNAD